MPGRDPEVAELTRQTARLMARAELIYDDLVRLQDQILSFLQRASRYADSKER